MKKFTLNTKILLLTLPFLSLVNSQASSHTIENNEFGMDHALLFPEHSIPLVCIGILVSILMLTQKHSLILAGNLGLLGFLAYQVFVHSLGHSLLFGLEFLMVGGFISLASWQTTYWVFRVGVTTHKNFKSKLYKYFVCLDRFIGFQKVQAHCDVPCKIYDPSISIIAALSVIRLIDIINETHSMENTSSVEYANTMTRCIQRKEEESEKLKQEIRIIWGDYFKAPQLEAFPQVHNSVHKIMMLASAAKQGVNRKEAEELLELTNQFAEIFWTTKGIETERKIAPYPPNLAVVRPKL